MRMLFLNFVKTNIILTLSFFMALPCSNEHYINLACGREHYGYTYTLYFLQFNGTHFQVAFIILQHEPIKHLLTKLLLNFCPYGTVSLQKTALKQQHYIVT